jgi:hypothetical protein
VFRAKVPYHVPRRSVLDLLCVIVICFNGAMDGFQKYTAAGHSDLEPFWPSRQHHDFDRVCCRAMNAQAL